MCVGSSCMEKEKKQPWELEEENAWDTNHVDDFWLALVYVPWKIDSPDFSASSIIHSSLVRRDSEHREGHSFGFRPGARPGVHHLRYSV